MDAAYIHGSYANRGQQQWNPPDHHPQHRPKGVPDAYGGSTRGAPKLEVTHYAGAHDFVETNSLYLTVSGSYHSGQQPPGAFTQYPSSPNYQQRRPHPESRTTFYENAYDFKLDNPTFLNVEGDLHGPFDPRRFLPASNTGHSHQPCPSRPVAYNYHGQGPVPIPPPSYPPSRSPPPSGRGTPHYPALFTDGHSSSYSFNSNSPMNRGPYSVNQTSKHDPNSAPQEGFNAQPARVQPLSAYPSAYSPYPPQPKRVAKYGYAHDRPLL